MTRRNRTPEEKARREKIRELLQLTNIGSMYDIQNLFKETIADDDLIFKFGVQQIVPRDGHVLRRKRIGIVHDHFRQQNLSVPDVIWILVLIREVSAKLGTYASRSLSCAAILNAASVPPQRKSACGFACSPQTHSRISCAPIFSASRSYCGYASSKRGLHILDHVHVARCVNRYRRLLLCRCGRTDACHRHSSFQRRISQRGDTFPAPSCKIRWQKPAPGIHTFYSARLIGPYPAENAAIQKAASSSLRETGG